MNDLQEMPQKKSEALYKFQELNQENQYYWWVTKRVLTPALGTEYVCPSLSSKQCEGSGSILLAP